MAALLLLLSVVGAYDVKSLTTAADLVLVGRVVGQRAQWTDDRRAIFTDVEVELDGVWRGARRRGEHVVVRHLGGTVDGIGMRTIGEPRFAPRDEVVLFLRRLGPVHHVVGMAQGKLDVTRSPA